VQSLGVIQVALQWTMFSIIIILFLLYFPAPQTAPPPADQEHAAREHHDQGGHSHHHIPRPSEILHSEYTPPTHRTAVGVSVASAVYFLVCAVVSIVFLVKSTHQARVWAAWLGVISMVLATCQYLPQLWVTWRIKVLPLNSMNKGQRLTCSASLHYQFR